MDFVARFHQQQIQEDAAADRRGEGTFEWRLDRRMRDAAIAWAMDHPRRVLQLMGTKLLRIWSFAPNAAELQNDWLRAMVMAAYIPLLLLGIWGVWSFAGRGWPYILCCLPAVYFSLLHMIFVGSIRYRQPAMLTLIVLAAAVLCQQILPRLPWRQGALAARSD